MPVIFTIEAQQLSVVDDLFCRVSQNCFITLRSQACALFLDWCFRFHSISLSVLNFPLFERIEYLSSIMFGSKTKYLAFSLFLGHS